MTRPLTSPYRTCSVERSIAAGVAIVVWTLVMIWSSGSAAAAGSSVPPGSSSETIHVKFRDGVDVQLPQAALSQDLRNAVVSITSLFSLPKHKLDQIRARGQGRTGRTQSNLSLWFKIALLPGTDPVTFLDKLRRLPSVEIAELAPLPQQPQPTTPDFSANQGYLFAAPGGIDALFSWTISGGSGSGITIYDVEYSWNQTHEDLAKAHGLQLLLDVGDTAVDPFADNNHGTAVLGELVADNDTKGITGISWGASIGLAPANTAQLGYNPANAILLAVAAGSAGDVIVVEQQFPVCGLPNFGPIEVLASVFSAIQTAVANGFVVVEAAGNGSVDLDQAACGTAFDRATRDSGAIIVGAGQPPGTGVDRQRLAFSTFGSRVDLQGWGSGVFTTGYGTFYQNPSSPTDPTFWYTAGFDGTSSATPIVAGAVANIQGIALQQLGKPLSPSQMRTLLAQTGSPQLGSAEHIGPRPDLRRAIAALSDLAPEVGLDIKPGDTESAINPRSKGVIPVAILTTDTFDARTVDPLTVRFGPNGALPDHARGHVEDVTGDGRPDLVLHFRTAETGIVCGDTSVALIGQTFTGQRIHGSAAIRTTGCK